MGAPTVPVKILAEGYEINTDQDGIRATVPCLVAWSDAFTFHDQVLGFPTVTRPGGKVTYNIPWRFPASRAPIYASTMRIVPAGTDGGPLVGTAGLSPGEFFSQALCYVEFRSRGFLQSVTDDPSSDNQLDPENPILFIEQSVRGGAKMVPVPGVGYLFDDDNTPVIGDFGYLQPEARLTLTYPWLPFQPWQSVASLLGSLNNAALFGCATGTLMFEEFESRPQGTAQGEQGSQITYVLAYQGRDWNTLPKANGAWVKVHQQGAPSSRIYDYADLSALFF